MTTRRQRTAQQIARFVRQYARKADPNGTDPNDRQYSRKVEAAVKRMPAARFYELLNADSDEDAAEPRKPISR